MAIYFVSRIAVYRLPSLSTTDRRNVTLRMLISDSATAGSGSWVGRRNCNRQRSTNASLILSCLVQRAACQECRCCCCCCCCCCGHRAVAAGAMATQLGDELIKRFVLSPIRLPRPSVACHSVVRLSSFRVAWNPSRETLVALNNGRPASDICRPYCG
jgi:hypothetical protein